MNSIKTIKHRHLIPRWKSIGDAFESRELIHFKKNEAGPDDFEEMLREIQQAHREWQSERSLLSAIEYLEKQQIAGVDLDGEAVCFVRKEIAGYDNVPNELMSLLDEWTAGENFSTNYEDSIHLLKNRVILCRDNAYLWLELARNYFVLGHKEKAEKCLIVARGLAPNDRYIARSMMRFYHHTKNVDKALYYVRKMENLLRDPMLLSGEIALTNICGNVSKNVRRAKQLIESTDYSPFAVSELSSEIATMEIMSGHEKIGKRIMARNKDWVTENSYAQIAWVNQAVVNIPWIDELAGKKIENNFEGDIYYNFSDRSKLTDWKYLYSQCQAWSEYQPFSCTPVFLGGTISSDFLDDPQEALRLSKRALNCCKDEPALLNNLAYFAILSDAKEEAERYLYLQELSSNINEDYVLFYATKGLYEYRFGDPSKGKESYCRSCELSKQISQRLHTLVLAYFYRELDRTHDYPEMLRVKEELSKCKINSNDFLLVQLMEKFNIS